MEKKIDSKKLGILLLILAAVVGILIVVLMFVRSGDKGDEGAVAEKPHNAVVDIVDGSTGTISDSKMDAYATAAGRNKDKRSSNSSAIGNYWDSMSDEKPDEDPLAELSKDSHKKAVGELTVEDVFGPQANSAPSTSSGSEPVTRRRRIDEFNSDEFLDKYYEKYDKRVNQARQQNEAEPAEETKEPEQPVQSQEVLDRINNDDVVVKRSSNVSSMDDGFGTVGSGLSSLDAPVETVVDDSYPFKCMFVREEKVKNGSRVSVRLLEDMVVGGQLVPKNTHLMANCSLGSRLDMNISSIEIGGRIITINYDAYDATDGTKGIFCPNVDDNVGKQAKQQGLNLGFNRARTAVGGIAQDALQLGNVILQNTGSEKTVTVPAGYQFYILKSKKR